MMKFVEDPGIVARMGAASRVLAEEAFDVRLVNSAILGFMRLPAR